MSKTTVPGLRKPLDPRLLVSYGLAFACLILLGTTTSRGFDPSRILTILGDNTALGLVAIGQTMVLLNRGLDLSVGAVMNLSSVVLASVMVGEPSNIPAAVALALAGGLAVGLVNGFLVAKTNIAPLLATLAVATIVQGIYFIYTRGQPKGAIADAFRTLADGRILGTIPWSLPLWAGAWLLAALFLYRTVAGRRFYAVGGNPRAAWLSGVATDRYVITAYALAGVYAALAGIHLTAFTGSPSVTAGDSFTLTSIAAAVIGGVVLTGGVGSPTGTFAGVLVLVFLGTVLSTFNVPSPVQLIVQGGVLIIMMMVNNRLDPARRGS